MIAVIVAILTLTVVGLPLTLAVDRAARGPLLLGLAILYGSGAVMLALMLLSLCHIRWTALYVILVLLAFDGIAWTVAKRSTRNPTRRVEKPTLHLLDAGTAIMVASFTAY